MCDFYNDFFSLLQIQLCFIHYIEEGKKTNWNKCIFHTDNSKIIVHAVGIEWSRYGEREREKTKLNELNPNTSEDRQVPENIEKKIQTKEKNNP